MNSKPIRRLLLALFATAALPAAQLPAHAAGYPDKPLTFIEIGYLLPRGDMIFKAFVDQWLHQTIESGDFATLLDKWLAHPWP